MTEVTSWLISVPVNDGNFKSNLKRATVEEIKQAIVIVENSGRSSKTKLQALNRALKRLEGQA